MKKWKEASQKLFENIKAISALQEQILISIFAQYTTQPSYNNQLTYPA